MSDELIRGSYTVGALLRRPFRRVLMMLDVKWQEDRGVLTSLFIVTATAEDHGDLHDLGHEMSGRRA